MRAEGAAAPSAPPSVGVPANGVYFSDSKAQFTRESSRSTLFCVIQKSGALKGCVQIEPFRSKKCSGRTVPIDRTVLFSCEQPIPPFQKLE